MTAPTLVDIRATTASATASLTPATTVAEGDLVIFAAMGNTTSITSTALLRGGSADSSWVYIGGQDGSGTARTRLWGKVLTSADFYLFGGVTLPYSFGPSGFVSSGTTRLAIAAFRAPTGYAWSSTVKSSVGHAANVTNGSSVAALTDSPRPQVAVSAVTFASAQNALTLTWDGGTAKDPWVDESASTTTTGTNDGTRHYGTGTGSCQLDFALYDSSGTTTSIAYSAGIANTTHAIMSANWDIAPVSLNASGRADTVASPKAAAKLTARTQGRADTTNDGRSSGPIAWKGSGRADSVASPLGRGAGAYARSGRADSVAATYLPGYRTLAAPVLVATAATQTASAISVTTSGAAGFTPAVGDLAIFAATTNATQLPTVAGVNYADTGTNAGWTLDLTADGATAGNMRLAVWSKIITADDLTGTTLKSVTPAGLGSATSPPQRLELVVLRAAHGWDAARLVTTGAHTTNSGQPNGTFVQIGGSLAASRPHAALAFAALSGTVGGTVFSWDGSTATTPWFDNSTSTTVNGTNDGTRHYGTGSAQFWADFRLYDGSTPGTSVAINNGTANSLHAIGVVVYQQAPWPGYTASGRADTVAAPTARSVTAAKGNARGDAVSSASVRVPSTTKASGRADTVAASTASNVAGRRLTGRGDNVTNATGRPYVRIGQGDSIAWSYAFPIVTRRAGGRADTVTGTIANASGNTTSHASGSRVGNVTDSPAHATVAARAISLTDTTADAYGAGYRTAGRPRLNITITTAPATTRYWPLAPDALWVPARPERLYAATQPAARWLEEAPTVRWASRPPVT